MLNSHVNKIILVGRVETAQLPARLNSKQSLVTNFELRTRLQVRTGSGFLVEESFVHSVTAWGDLARLCVTNLREGSLVYIEGRLCWDDARQPRARSEWNPLGPKPQIIAEQIRLLQGGEGDTDRSGNTHNSPENDGATVIPTQEIRADEDENELEGEDYEGDTDAGEGEDEDGNDEEALEDSYNEASSIPATTRKSVSIPRRVESSLLFGNRYSTSPKKPTRRNPTKQD